MEASLQEIYNLLLAGEKLELSFDSAIEAEQFRVSMAQFKTRQDRKMLGIGMLESEDDREMLSFSFDPVTGVASLSFKQRPASRKFSIRIVDSDG